MASHSISPGQELPSVTHVVTRRNILRYGKMVGGFNPVHEDDDLAEELGFEGIIAHGVMHLNYITQMLCDYAGHPDGVKKVDVKFRKPVYADEEITARVEIESVEDRGSFHAVTCRVWSEKADGTRVVEGTAEVELPK